MLAAGLLSAVIQPDGTVLAADGELLIGPGAARPERSLIGALRPDPAAVLPAPTITSVLATVGFEDPGATTAVSADGRWRNGPLRGRHVAAKARHIGAAARAAHRQERIAAIDAELASWRAGPRQRERRRAELDGTVRALDELVRSHDRSPPSCSRPAGSRPRAPSRAERSAGRAAREAERARKQRADLGRRAEHPPGHLHSSRAAAGKEALAGVTAAATRARDGSTRLGKELNRLASRSRRHGEQLAAGGGGRRTARREPNGTRTRPGPGGTPRPARSRPSTTRSICLSSRRRTSWTRPKTGAATRRTGTGKPRPGRSAQLGPQLGTAQAESRRGRRGR